MPGYPCIPRPAGRSLRGRCGRRLAVTHQDQERPHAGHAHVHPPRGLAAAHHAAAPEGAPVLHHAEGRAAAPADLVVDPHPRPEAAGAPVQPQQEGARGMGPEPPVERPPADAERVPADGAVPLRHAPALLHGGEIQRGQGNGVGSLSGGAGR